jgi:hypothetical protein
VFDDVPVALFFQLNRDLYPHLFAAGAAAP